MAKDPHHEPPTERQNTLGPGNATKSSAFRRLRRFRLSPPPVGYPMQRQRIAHRNLRPATPLHPLGNGLGNLHSPRIIRQIRSENTESKPLSIVKRTDTRLVILPIVRMLSSVVFNRYLDLRIGEIQIETALLPVRPGTRHLMVHFRTRQSMTDQRQAQLRLHEGIRIRPHQPQGAPAITESHGSPPFPRSEFGFDVIAQCPENAGLQHANLVTATHHGISKQHKVMQIEETSRHQPGGARRHAFDAVSRHRLQGI
ncbi:hypothetical protein PSRA_1571 [Pseudoscardovia radai]|uniref:Uncharacterized protein n=1 Tax=Pseudoscardovia radai TaxID=987066 RepID=A0A261ESY8_9BIFI|nr:hypothetical protein PSRA_1571 [Pseudoscardovia radai]